MIPMSSCLKFWVVFFLVSPVSLFGLEYKIWLECVPTLPTLLCYDSGYYRSSLQPLSHCNWLAYISVFLTRPSSCGDKGLSHKLVLMQCLLAKCSGRNPQRVGFLVSVLHSGNVWCWCSAAVTLVWHPLGSFSHRCKSELERSQQAAQSADVSLNSCLTPQKIFATPLTPSQYYSGKDSFPFV